MPIKVVAQVWKRRINILYRCFSKWPVWHKYFPRPWKHSTKFSQEHILQPFLELIKKKCIVSFFFHDSSEIMEIQVATFRIFEVIITNKRIYFEFPNEKLCICGKLCLHLLLFGRAPDGFLFPYWQIMILLIIFFLVTSEKGK